MPSTRKSYTRTATGAKRGLQTRATDKRIGSTTTGTTRRNTLTGKRTDYVAVGTGSKRKKTDAVIIAKANRVPAKKQYTILTTTPNKTGNSSRAQSVSLSAYLKYGKKK